MINKNAVCQHVRPLAKAGSPPPPHAAGSNSQDSFWLSAGGRLGTQVAI